MEELLSELNERNLTQSEWTQLNDILKNMTTEQLTILFCLAQTKNNEINKHSRIQQRWVTLCQQIKNAYDIAYVKEAPSCGGILSSTHALDIRYYSYSKLKDLLNTH
jgi:hypothetical protein